MNTPTMSTELVHVPAEPVVYDAASPVYRFLHKQWSRFRAVLAQKGLPAPLARYAYRARHKVQPGQKFQTRIVEEGKDTGQRFEWTEPTLRERIRQARAQRRQTVRTPMHDTAAYPTIKWREEDSWSWHTAPEWLAREQRRYNNGQMALSGAEGPLTS